MISGLILLLPVFLLRHRASALDQRIFTSLRKLLAEPPASQDCLIFADGPNTELLQQMLNDQMPHVRPTAQFLASLVDAQGELQERIDSEDLEYRKSLRFIFSDYMKMHPKALNVALIGLKDDPLYVDRSNNVQQSTYDQKQLSFLRRHIDINLGINSSTVFIFDVCQQPKTVSLLIPFTVATGTSDTRWLLQVGLKLDFNQCSDSEHFPALHKCLNRSQCIFVSGRGLQLGSYKCCCETNSEQCVGGEALEAGNSSAPSDMCLDFQPDPVFRKVLLSINAICAIVSLSLIFMVLTQRKVQEFGARGWALMEIFLLGAVLLYCVVAIEFLAPGAWNCCVTVWLRELGFVAFYGAIILKIYRNLVEYRVRKAHHVYVKEKDLFKYLVTALVMTGTGLAAWTLGGAQRAYQAPFVQQGVTTRGVSYNICRLEWWSCAWHVYEVLALFYGLWLCYKARNTTWVERWQFTFAVILEIVVTAAANFSRYYLWYRSSPDTTLLISFIQSHMTITVNILLIMVPKFYYVSVDHSGRALAVVGAGSNKAHPSLAKLRDNLVNGTVDFAEVPIAEMNSEDIRAELKRVYTQLRMYKLKNAYDDNPHISKKKHGKKQSYEKQPGNKRRLSYPSVSHRQKEALRLEEERGSTIVSPDDEGFPLACSPVGGASSDPSIQSSPQNAYLSRGGPIVPSPKRLSATTRTNDFPPEIDYSSVRV